GQWRVIAYTYDHAEQAQQKSAAITQKHPELRPEVFTPSGHAPYLVTVGGTMSRDEAFALARKVRSEGLPLDSYAQNYRGNGP
ncbi:MAG: SPOR domain-containing protein, partial [Silvibacterium sp.]